MWIEVVSVPWSTVEAVVCTSLLGDRRQSAMGCFLKMLVGALGRRVTAQCGELCGGCERMTCSASVWGEVTCPLMHSRAVTRLLKGCRSDNHSNSGGQKWAKISWLGICSVLILYNQSFNHSPLRHLFKNITLQCIYERVMCVGGCWSTYASVYVWR